MIAKELKQAIEKAVEETGLGPVKFAVEHPEEMDKGDYATNVAMVLAKVAGDNPKSLAEKLASKIKHPSVERVEVAGPGFINFFLKPEFFTSQVEEILKLGDQFGNNEDVKGVRVMVEYTDPNPFKLFHIGHLLPNVIGESISRICEASGADVKRACYQGDVGLHVAKAIYGLQQGQTLFDAYAFGNRAYEENEVAKKEIVELNKKVYDRNDNEVNKLYDEGKQESLKYFEEIYKKLGTKFDYYFFESETGEFGKQVVEDNLNIFEKSDGAVVYRGEQDGLHTRVFINSEGLPTYEAKELGLAKIKYNKYPYDYSIVVTAHEIDEYFKVLLAVMKKIFPELAAKTKHISHGMLRLPSGKMSSRTGNVITAESLINEVKDKVKERVKDNELGDEILTQISVGAIKYSILKQDSSRDIIFDFDKSISFEGNSGPYLQYTFARTQSVLDKAQAEGVKAETKNPEIAGDLEKLLARFPEAVYRAGEEMAPHHVTTYLTNLASAFNAYYANNKIVSADAESPYRVALTGAVGQTLKNGLTLLGIAAPVKM